MAKFTERQNRLTAATRELDKYIGMDNAAIAQFTTAKNGLAAMPTKYSDLINEIDTEAANNPGDEAIQHQKRLKDKLVADFQAEKTRATDLESAVSGM